jgi:hypothetical protein
VLMGDYFNPMMIPQWFDTLLGVCLNREELSDVRRHASGAAARVN